MRGKRSLLSPLAAVIALSAVLVSACTPAHEGTAPTTTASHDGGKIPVTTVSEEAKREFLEGRSLAERLLAQDSLAHLDKAISLDPNFAYAELARANASQTAKEFFEHLNRAVSLADKASEGERLLILAAEAGANGDAVKQKEYLEKLVAAHPNDERANFNLGGYYFGQQDFAKAITHYKKATDIAPDYSPAYNILGYAYRQSGDFANAEQSFKRYIELIPNDPNPYDSYGELLLKMGRYDDAIAQYRKALSINPSFVPSHVGIATSQMYQGKADEATSELQAITENARNDGERRTALFGRMILEVDRGRMDAALAELDKQYALGEKTNDIPAMTGDLQTRGAILLEMGRYDEAKKQFDRIVELTEASSLSPEIKENTKRFHHFNLASVAAGKKDFETARAEAEEFRKGAEESKNPGQIRLAHQLAGTIALAENDYDRAISELEQSSLQNPQNLYRLGLAYRGKGDSAKAKEYLTKAADFNSLPQLNYAIVRTKAKEEAGGTGA